MIRNYFKIAIRNLVRNKVYSSINIVGLSLGLACAMLIILYVKDELDYDKYNTYADRIYRIDYHIKFGDFSYKGTEAPAIMGPVFANDHPQIEQYVRLRPYGDFVVKKEDENLRENKGAFADSTLFDVFSLQMIAGDKKTALKEPNSIVITEASAKKYFNSTEVTGKTLVINNNNHKVTGVIKDIPAQSHFHFDFFFATAGSEQSRNSIWLNNNFQTYLLVKPQTDVARLEKQLNQTLMANTSLEFQDVLNMSKEEFENAGNTVSMSLRPLTDIHLHSAISDEFEANGDIQYIYIYSAIAVFIVLIACVNFMNLSTARSANRAKEVGVRKVVGGARSGLIMQFLSESVFISFLSFLTAIIIVVLALPYFNQLAGKQMNLQILLLPKTLFSVLLLMLAVGLVAGSYPAFFLSAFQPVKVLKGHVARGFKGSLIRNSLVVFQFSVSVILMVGTVVIFNQLNYIQNKNLGFNKDQVLILQRTYTVNTEAFRQELLKMEGVKAVTVTDFLPVNGVRRERGYVTTPVFDGHNFTLMQQWAIDENYIPTLEIKVKKGRNFSSAFLTDSNAVLINEAAAALFGGEDPVNKKLYRIENLRDGDLIPYTIIGVVDNFNYNSLHEKVAPLVLNLEPDNAGMAIKINTSDIPGLVNEIKNKWKAMSPAQPFIYSFMDDDFNNQYKSVQRTGAISIIFSVLSIAIACLGLFGLVTYAAEQRMKEIGIRKVLGAAVTDVVSLLSRDFVKLIAISIGIATPLAWWAMNRWLENFAYGIEIQWWIFAAAGLAAVMIALLTVSFQAIKAAMANPVKSLRTE